MPLSWYWRLLLRGEGRNFPAVPHRGFVLSYPKAKQCLTPDEISEEEHRSGAKGEMMFCDTVKAHSNLSVFGTDNTR